MNKILVSLVLLGLTVFVDSHFLEPNAESIQRIIANGNGPESYHIHVQYILGLAERHKKAIDLRERFRKRFEKDIEKTPCSSVYEETYDKLCLFSYPLTPKRGSIYMSGDWAVNVPIAKFGEVVRWIIQFRDDFDVTVHPNTLNPLKDHTTNALQAGRVWPINYSFLPESLPAQPKP